MTHSSSILGRERVCFGEVKGFMSQQSAPSCFPFSLAETTSETVAMSGLLTRAQQKELSVFEVGFMESNYGTPGGYHFILGC